MTRHGSKLRMAFFFGTTAVLFGVLYFPTLTGGYPWSWVIADASPAFTLLIGTTFGALCAHWWWPARKHCPRCGLPWGQAWPYPTVGLATQLPPHSYISTTPPTPGLTQAPEPTSSKGGTP